VVLTGSGDQVLACEGEKNVCQGVMITDICKIPSGRGESEARKDSQEGTHNALEKWIRN
jgi:hypothetical protein